VPTRSTIAGMLRDAANRTADAQDHERVQSRSRGDRL